MIHLDTHVVVFLYAGLFKELGTKARESIREHDLIISPIVRLELQYLYETGRTSIPAEAVISELSLRIGLGLCSRPFSEVVKMAEHYSWTRDPFDRLIVAQAALGGHALLTRDRIIRKHYDKAIWN